MAADDLSVSLSPVEDLKGGGSRTRHLILKQRHASLSQSVYSCMIGEKIAPNRDYPGEGLSCLIDGDYWKFIDTIALGCILDDRWLKLEPAEVIASPWECKYLYDAEKLKATVTYYVSDAPGGTGAVDVAVGGRRADEATVVLEPFFDVRFMSEPTVPGSLHARAYPETLAVSAGDRTVCVRSPGAQFIRKGREVPWEYRLGTGERIRKDGRLRFIPERRVVKSFYEIRSAGRSAMLRFACGRTLQEAMKRLDAGYDRNDAGRAQAVARALSDGPAPLDRGVLLRALGVDRFGMGVGNAVLPEAGDLWQKSVWFRDAFEGLMHNYRTIALTGGTPKMKAALLASFDLQDDFGRMPNRLVPGGGEQRPDYNSADATLLGFILCGLVVRDTSDEELAVTAAEAFRKYLMGVKNSDVAENGPPRVRPNGLISVPAWHSWTDGMRNVDGFDLPARVSEAWQRALITRDKEHELFEQKFLLPEINAQWMRALEAGWLFSRYDRDYVLADVCKGLYDLALEAFKPVFLNPDTGFINNVVGTDDFALGPQVDATPGSPGVVAAAMLGPDVFSLRELGNLAAYAKAHLLRTKWGMPFGVIVKESGRRAYLGEEEDHEAVVWPRDTPYLIRLLRLAGDEATVAGLLASNLRHQMEEGFVFYNNELFSGDGDLVPAKDPVQWWSQWVDPYLERRSP